MTNTMTHRERFVSLFQGLPVDRAPFIDLMGVCNYRSCLPRWKREGLAAGADVKEVQSIVGFDYARGFLLQAKYLFYPEFDVEMIRRDGDKTFSRNRWGGIEIQKDDSEFMPLTLEGVVKDRKSWDAVKERLSAASVSSRFPSDFDDICLAAEQSGLPVYTGDLPAGFFGAPRELFGFNSLIYLFYDDPDLLHEVLDTLCDLWIEMMSYVQQRVHLDYYFVWEDMCSKTGPMISPDMFREFLLPRYKRFTERLRKGGCSHVMVDSDGDERLLVPLWMEGGVNIVLPWESQFGLDLMEVRREYRTLGIAGGLNKRVLEFGRCEMDRELEKVPWLLESGYYIPSCDHGVTNDVSWDNYRYFYDKLREMIYKYTPGTGS